MTARDVIAQALALSEAATDGPWEYIGGNVIDTPPVDVDEADWGPDGLSGICIGTRQDRNAYRYADAEFIAHARTLLPVLAKALRDVLDVFDDQAVEGFSDTTSAVRIYRAITALSEVTE